MNGQSIPEKAQKVLLEDAAGRDRATARRTYLFKILWSERFLTRAQLLVRVEGALGRGCFGKSAWEDNFYRDMRVVKQAFKKAGYSLQYSRSKKQPGYYLHIQPRLNLALAQAIAGSISEVDAAQIVIFQSLTPAERYHQGCAISETARRAVMHRIQSEQPDSNPAEVRVLAIGKASHDL